MKIVNTPGLSMKVAVALDILGTLLIEHMGFTLQLPFYHPLIVSVVLVLTYTLFKWKEEITGTVILIVEALLTAINEKNKKWSTP